MSAVAPKWRTLWALFGLVALLFLGSIMFIISRAH